MHWVCVLLHLYVVMFIYFTPMLCGFSTSLFYILGMWFNSTSPHFPTSPRSLSVDCAACDPRPGDRAVPQGPRLPGVCDPRSQNKGPEFCVVKTDTSVGTNFKHQLNLSLGKVSWALYICDPNPQIRHHHCLKVGMSQKIGYFCRNQIKPPPQGVGIVGQLGPLRVASCVAWVWLWAWLCGLGPERAPGSGSG